MAYRNSDWKRYWLEYIAVFNLVRFLGNRKQGTGNREQGTGNREQGTEKKYSVPD
ncbi:hypothetical protein [Moorena sp. SIO4G3]|uniref:hypothetical protein n=1 Tax=Moorena sp. SIO4G3 TaxID=2607821 RepID=UPI0014292A12|nr:hypothetical protein [Moorena sp. SIO4G3]NEO81473.1 hypothetical protein [Moorena sp. SIO4G3]